MAKQKHATLIFRSGKQMNVPLKQPDGFDWPPFIDYKTHVMLGVDPLTTGDAVFPVLKSFRFNYVGVQHGVGAYLEQEPV